jgi:hypothetical protein
MIKPAHIHHSGTPQEVLDAIYVIAKYLSDNNYVEASVSKEGGAAFHVQSRIEREMEYMEEIKNLREWT